MNRLLIFGIVILFGGLSCVWLAAAFVLVPDMLTTNGGEYPVADSREVRGGFMQVQTTSARNSIPLFLRYTGQMVYVAQTDTNYQLRGGTANNNWQVWAGSQGPRGYRGYTGAAGVAGAAATVSVGTTTTVAYEVPANVTNSGTSSVAILNFTIPRGQRGYDGRDGKTLTCYVTGIQTITYDANGLNPKPTLIPFASYLYKNGNLKNAQTISWSVPSTKTLLSGSGSSQTFTPSVFGIFSASKSDNRVMALLGYSSNYCRAVAPVSITQVGQQGIQGPPGQDATVTKPAVLSTFLNTAGGGALFIRQGNDGDTATQLGVMDRNEFPRFYVTGNGNVYLTNASGSYHTKIGGDGRITSYYGGVARFEIISGGKIQRGYSPTGMLVSERTSNGGETIFDQNGRVRYRRYTGARSGGISIEGKINFNKCGGCHLGSPGLFGAIINAAKHIVTG